VSEELPGWYIGKAVWIANNVLELRGRDNKVKIELE
jgi:hypothetical protein